MVDNWTCWGTEFQRMGDIQEKSWKQLGSGESLDVSFEGQSRIKAYSEAAHFWSTGFGFLNALCKAAAVLGNLIFGSLVGITKAIPILLASAVLVCGGLVGLRLPDTRNQVLM
ncbi:unnamed protein product [Ranitomeya imitator]|uniref:Uncharacterized protein n=1 Tax=Ranitomeya imitator TaxID=111125 RepID=A0ABN9MBS9_9NEOB|nr:unnamed protein product [Ranitomeya imitator]